MFAAGIKVFCLAYLFSKHWAQSTFADEWEVAKIKGTVIREYQPRSKAMKARFASARAVWVVHYEGDEKPMMSMEKDLSFEAQ